MDQTLNDKFKALASGLVVTSFVSRHALQDRRSCCPGHWATTPVQKATGKSGLMPSNFTFGWRSSIRLIDE